MGIFYDGNNEKRSYNPSADDIFSAFPSGIVSAMNMTWSEYEALRNSDIFTAVTTIAKDIARFDIKIKTDGVFKEKDRLDNLINNRPNDIYNGYSLKLSTLMSALLTGVGYILIERANNQPVSLFHIPTSRLQLKQDKKGYFYEFNNNGKTERVEFKDVIAIKPYTEDGLNTLSILKSLKDDLDTQNYSKRFFANFFRNGTQAGSVLKMKDGKLSPEARRKIKEEWQKANSGENNSNSTIVLDETMDFSKLEVNTDILKLITANKSSTVAIAKAFGLPLSKLGVEQPNTSLQDSMNDYLYNTLGSYMKVWTSELNFKLISTKDDYIKSFEFDTSDYRSINYKEYVETLNSQLDKGGISLDEYRKALGLPPIPNGLGSKHRVDLNHIDLNLADSYQLRDTSSNNQSIDTVDKSAFEDNEEN